MKNLLALARTGKWEILKKATLHFSMEQVHESS
jgi:hypothetical protein